MKMINFHPSLYTLFMHIQSATNWMHNPDNEPGEVNQTKKMEIFAKTGIKWTESEGTRSMQTVNITKLST